MTIKLKVLVAEPRDILRAGLRTLFTKDERIGHLYEAPERESMKSQLYSNTFDLVVVNQVFITDINELPRDRFMVITAQFDFDIFLAAFKHGAKAYLLEESSAEILRIPLGLADGAFFIDPIIAQNVLVQLLGDMRYYMNDDILTPREKQIIQFLRNGIDRPTIAKHLCISQATLKTHIKNIARKRGYN